MHELEDDKSALMSDPDKLIVIFREMIQMCLWYVCRLIVSWSRCTYADICLYRGNATVSPTSCLLLTFILCY